MQNKENITLPWTMAMPILALMTMIWLCVILYSYPLFQAARATDPYATINTIFPQFYMFLAIYIIMVLAIFHRYKTGIWTTLGFLFLSAAVLWYTPYLMAGWVKQTDTLWHMGMAVNVNEILDGVAMPFSTYTSSFPVSYVVGNMIYQVTGMELQPLANYVLPLFFTVLFTLLIYIILARFFSKDTAVMATLMSITLLHYVELHMSPHVIGMVILFTCILLFSMKRWTLAAILGFALLPLTHTVSFAFFVLFLGLYFSYQMGGFNFLMGKKDSQKISKKLVFTLVTMGIVGIIFIIMFTSLSIYVDIFLESISLSRLYDFIVNNLVNNPWFKALGAGIYLAMFILFCYFIMKKLPIASKGDGGLENLAKLLFRNNSMLPLFAIGSLALGIVIASVLDRSVMIERGLTIFLIFASGFILARVLNHPNKKYSAFMIIFIAALFVIYPMASYPVDNYNSFPVSEEDGMIFISEMELTGIAIDMSSPGQLDAFIAPGMNINTSIEGNQSFDIVVYRMSNSHKYYLHTGDADDYNHKFEKLDRDRHYSSIYYNPTFVIYSKTDNGVYS